MKKRIKLLTVLVTVIIGLSNCDAFYQREYIETIQIGWIEDEAIYCDLYQSGIDNYLYEFKKVTYNDTVDLFDGYLNDAVHGNEAFELIENGDTVQIITAKPMMSNSKHIDERIYKLMIKK